METWPPSRAISAWPDDLKGTCVMLVPALRFTITPMRWVEEPTPPEAKVRLVFFARSISSARVLAGTSGWTIRITGAWASMVIAVKPFSVS